MEEDRSVVTRTLKMVGFGLLAFAITTLAGGVWSVLLVTNLRSSPAVPWSVPTMALLLWLMWGYLGGKGWPRTTSYARRHSLRANRRSARTYLWSFSAQWRHLHQFLHWTECWQSESHIFMVSVQEHEEVFVAGVSDRVHRSRPDWSRVD